MEEYLILMLKVATPIQQDQFHFETVIATMFWRKIAFFLGKFRTVVSAPALLPVFPVLRRAFVFVDAKMDIFGQYGAFLVCDPYRRCRNEYAENESAKPFFPVLLLLMPL